MSNSGAKRLILALMYVCVCVLYVYICMYIYIHTHTYVPILKSMRNEIDSINIIDLHSHLLLFFYGATTPSGPGHPHYRGFTIRHITFGKNPLDE
jgi:hypothetical protein